MKEVNLQVSAQKHVSLLVRIFIFELIENENSQLFFRISMLNERRTLLYRDQNQEIKEEECRWSRENKLSTYLRDLLGKAGKFSSYAQGRPKTILCLQCPLEGHQDGAWQRTKRKDLI